MLEVKNLSVTYNGNIKALKNVNLNVNKGELVVDALWQSTKYIEVISNTELSINTSYDSSLKYGIAFYDLSRKTIQVKSLTEGVNKLVVPNNARYFRACALKSFTAFNVTYTKPIPYSSFQQIKDD